MLSGYRSSYACLSAQVIRGILALKNARKVVIDGLHMTGCDGFVRIPLRWLSVEQMNTIPGRTWKHARPTRVHGCCMVVRGAPGQVPFCAIHQNARNFADAVPRARLIDDFGLTVACIGELARKLPTCPLMNHAAQSVWVSRVIHAIHDDFCHSKKTMSGLATGFEIKRLGQATPFSTTRCPWLAG